ncbi:FAD-dependent oxidoreductase [Eggerthella sp. NSJ-70]|uniref:FAD-dependent oxidoreductase n=1 Tax=Eggerthella hominis TaxID=2763043 RepID=A0ABR7BPX0_9ACTN|nr:FAD-dependent oxidoreductase [Eggerthella hominis]MBC5583634.1 FAD-dependent oxidoreductase [Eggerthella hominis]
MIASSFAQGTRSSKPGTALDASANTKEGTMGTLSRRNFLRGSVVAGAAMAGFGLAGCAPQSQANDSAQAVSASGVIPDTWDAEADVVILGAGGTGLSAACAAAQAGASVLVYDADAKAGGTTALSGGVIQAAGTKAQKEFTDFKDDTPEKHAQCYIEQAEGRADEELTKTMCSRAPELIDWLESIGLTWKRVYGNCHVPYVTEGLHADRIHVYEGGGAGGQGGVLTDTEFAEAERLGAQFNFKCKAQHLIYDPDKGVVGVQIEDGGKSINVKAARGVVMALGGMDRNEQLAFAFNAQQYWDLTTQASYISELAQGDGIRMGLEVNAALATCGGTIDYDMATGQATDNTAPQMPCLIVNGSGRRFVCEDATYAYQYRAIFQNEMQFGKPTWMIMDQNMVEQGVGPWAADPASAVADGTLLEADTLEELAEKIDVPSAMLVSTFDVWNKTIAETGEDVELHRVTQLIPLDKPPYYAHQNISANLGSLGGLKINTNCEVIDGNGDIIPHLYAGGMNSGGWYGTYYPGSGTSLTGGLVLGHIAGENAAAAQAWA